MKSGLKFWWAYGEDEINNSCRQLFLMFKGYFISKNPIIAQILVDYGKKIKDPEAEYQYKEWKQGLIDVLAPYVSTVYSAEDNKWMEAYLTKLDKWWYNLSNNGNSLITECKLHTLGFSYWLRAEIFFYSGTEKLLNPYWLYVSSIYSNWYNKHSLDLWIPNYDKGIKTMAQFDLDISIKSRSSGVANLMSSVAYNKRTQFTDPETGLKTTNYGTHHWTKKEKLLASKVIVPTSLNDDVRKKQEKERTHLMCKMAGYVLTDILGYKEEDYWNYKNIKLEDWQEFCNKYKTQIVNSLDKKQPTEPNAHSFVDFSQQAVFAK